MVIFGIDFAVCQNEGEQFEPRGNHQLYQLFFLWQIGYRVSVVFEDEKRVSHFDIFFIILLRNLTFRDKWIFNLCQPFHLF